MSHPTLPLAELKAILEIEEPRARLINYFAPIAMVECSFDSARRVVAIVTGRAGFVKEGGILLGLYSSEEELLSSFDGILDRLSTVNRGPYRIEAHRYLGLWRDSEPSEAALALARRAEARGFRVSPRSRSVISISYAEGVIVVGLRLAEQDPRGFRERAPNRRPFFKPGPLDPRLSRALVNLSRLRVGGTFWDPFCGTGGIVLEACLLGASRCLCGDIDVQMATGSKINLEYYGVGESALSHLADAVAPPLSEDVVDSVATDPPYGRSTTLLGRERRVLYREFLEAAHPILRKGSYLVFAAPAEEEPHKLAEGAGYRVLERHYMHVHGSLVREIVVARVGV
jgi:tRNA (guanine10-N2)-dimethyltransferase